MTRIDHAIARSVGYNEIVTVRDADATEVAEALARSDDYAVESDGSHDAWGVDESGEPWRLRVVPVAL